MPRLEISPSIDIHAAAGGQKRSSNAEILSHVKERCALSFCGFVVSLSINLKRRDGHASFEGTVMTERSIAGTKLPKIDIAFDTQTNEDLRKGNCTVLSFLLIKTSSTVSKLSWHLNLWEHLKTGIGNLWDLTLLPFVMLLALTETIQRIVKSIPFLTEVGRGFRQVATKLNQKIRKLSPDGLSAMSEIFCSLPIVILSIAVIILFWAIGIVVAIALILVLGFVALAFVFLFQTVRSFREMRNMPSSSVAMLVVQKLDRDDNYERLGVAHWEEDAFTQCNPESRHIILW
jgi:hypothetical protein